MPRTTSSLYTASIDLTKTFHSVSRKLLWDVLSIYECLEKHIRILRLLCVDMLATIMVDNDNCEPFQVKSGVKQKCVITPTSFTIFIATITHLIKNDLPPGIEIVYRTNGKLFNLARLMSKSKISTSSLIEFHYADDNSVAALSKHHLQQPSTVHIRNSDQP